MIFIRPIISLLIIVSVALLTGLFLASFGVKLWLGILVGIIIQFIAHNVYVSILDTYVALRNKKLENERIKEFSHQGLEVTCPCSKKRVDFVPIRLNEANSYKCNECEKTVSVYINADTALQTDPIISTDTTSALQPILTSISNGTAR
jgi:DNA-directed RNA polymerase subunit RPC12/RpoP